jgi:hypothetical protein
VFASGLASEGKTAPSDSAFKVASDHANVISAGYVLIEHSVSARCLWV